LYDKVPIINVGFIVLAGRKGASKEAEGAVFSARES